MEQVPLEPALDEMLAQALTRPQTLAELQARVMAAVARNATPDIEQRHNKLRHEYVQSVAALRYRFGRQLAEALILTGCIFFPTRLGVHALWIWLASLIGHPLAMSAGLLPLSLVTAGSIGLLLNSRRAARFV